MYGLEDDRKYFRSALQDKIGRDEAYVDDLNRQNGLGEKSVGTGAPGAWAQSYGQRLDASRFAPHTRPDKEIPGACTFGIDYTVEDGRTIHFLLESIDDVMEMIRKKSTGYTASELRFILRN